MKRRTLLPETIFVSLFCVVSLGVSFASAQSITFIGNISGAGAPNFMGRPIEIHVSGHYAFVVTDGDDAFNVVDVSDPTSPALVVSVQGFVAPQYLANPSALDVVGNLAYVLSSSNVGGAGITIFDMSDPTNPTVIGHLFHPVFGNANTIKVEDGLAYVVQGPNSWISVVDVSNPTAPTFLDFITLEDPQIAFPFDIDISADHAFIPGANNDTLYILDVSNPFSLQVVGTISGAGAPNFLDGAATVAVSGSHAYVGTLFDNSLTVIDVSNPQLPTFVSKVAGDGPPNWLGGARAVYLSLSHAFVTGASLTNNHALTVVDISDPFAPTVVASVQGAGAPNFLFGANEVFVRGLYAYVCALRDDSLSIFEIGGLAFQDLLGGLEALVDAGALPEGESNALAAKLDAALKKLDQGNVTAAANQLQAFINQVNDLIDNGVLSPAEGQPLIEAAAAIIAQL